MAKSEQKDVNIGDLQWVYRELVPDSPNNKPPVLMLHGLVSQSYSWREVMPALGEQGFRCIAPDWIGHGSSSKPDIRKFAYDPGAYLKALGDYIEALELDRFSLVVQGFLGVTGLLYAAQNPDKVEKLIILNTPLPPQADIPLKIKMMGWPMIGDVMTQDPLLVDRTLEGGGPYQVADDDLDVYRRPFLKSSDVGRSLMWTIRAMKVPQVVEQIAQGFADWSRPTLVAWGKADPWLSADSAEAFAKGLADGEYVELDQVGHYAQEDWAEKVSETIVPFLRKQEL
ncbi:alpha/beta fold hydrolase [Leptothoe sp. PORK10 BA2]|jgi:pimeloyl-ACP methyl ester carboxylesterase|uniref:alpha/beta fold hydrolase n=1 Tax=Leptothoe sp. PORK10 BA2 TaxID=3110254 RepID=UPI002B20C3D1|nr:alpha/beta fold hydrolase [Leptothoe sp. PORK10 BA2]MEA5462637.1 alpha/beta fold hydrolase [Leptothoe sp. PORK10 BA2]